jgi:hypothetical protein
LHNGNNYASLTIGHLIHLQGIYENLELVLTKIGYTAHDWMICGDLKVLCMLLGQQALYTKHPYCMCKWDSRAKVNPGSKNNGHQGKLLNPGAKLFCKEILSIRRKYRCHSFILN